MAYDWGKEWKNYKKDLKKRDPNSHQDVAKLKMDSGKDMYKLMGKYFVEKCTDAMKGEVACVQLDMDNMKKLNTNLKWNGTNEVLRLLAEVLTKDENKNVSVYRMHDSGDEFGMMITNLNKEAIHKMLNQLCATVTANCVNAKNIPVTISCGFAMWDQSYLHKEPLDWLKAAEAQLDAAKGFGKNCVAYEGNVDEAYTSLKQAVQGGKAFAMGFGNDKFWCRNSGDNAGWVYPTWTDEDKERKEWDDDNVDKETCRYTAHEYDGNYYLEVADGPWKGHYLTFDYDKGLFVTRHWRKASYWSYDASSKHLVCETGKAQGMKVTFRGRADPLYAYYDESQGGYPACKVFMRTDIGSGK